MKKLILEKRYDVIALIIAAFFPIYKNALSSISIIVFALVTVGLFFFTKQKFEKKNIKYLIITTGFYLYSIFSLFYSSDMKEGFSELKTSVPILLFPFVLFLFGGKITKTHFKYISLSFLIACTLQGIYIISQFYSHGLFSDVSETSFYNLPFRNLIFNLDYMKIHPSYLSLWFLFAVLIGIQFSVENLKKIKIYQHFIIGIAIIVLLFVSIVSSAKITLIGFVFAMLYFLFSKIKTWKMKILSILIFILISITSVFKIPILKARFIDEIRVTKFEAPKGKTHNSINIRFGIMQCFSDVFSKNWLFGVGIGDAQEKLNECYDENIDSDVFTNSSYNTHNNYFHYALITGVLGLSLFIIALFFQFQLAFSKHSVLFACFLIMIATSFLVENVLVRNHGVVFYAFFSTLFIKFTQNDSKV